MHQTARRSGTTAGFYLTAAVAPWTLILFF